tara:strand:- start:2867 stop:3232 length:366 start_codon:yes stop_codon:yes gene_type:complete
MSGLVNESADARSKTIVGNFRVRAWVSFSGTTSSPGLGDRNGNVSGITRNGNGLYTVTFAQSMEDTNYTFCGSATNSASPPHLRALTLEEGSKLAGSVKFAVKDDANNVNNEANVNIAIIR